MKKTVKVKTYTRKTKSGKTAVVRQHTANRDGGKGKPATKGAGFLKSEYDEDMRELVVTFMGGAKYRYHDVPPGIADDMEAGDGEALQKLRKKYTYSPDNTKAEKSYNSPRAKDMAKAKQKVATAKSTEGEPKEGGIWGRNKAVVKYANNQIDKADKKVQDKLFGEFGKKLNKKMSVKDGKAAVDKIISTYAHTVPKVPITKEKPYKVGKSIEPDIKRALEKHKGNIAATKKDASLKNSLARLLPDQIDRAIKQVASDLKSAKKKSTVKKSKESYHDLHSNIFGGNARKTAKADAMLADLLGRKL